MAVFRQILISTQDTPDFYILFLNKSFSYVIRFISVSSMLIYVIIMSSSLISKLIITVNKLNKRAARDLANMCRKRADNI